MRSFLFLLFFGLLTDWSLAQVAQPQSPSAVTQRRDAVAPPSDSLHLFEFGFRTMGYEKHVFKQLTGYSEFDNAETPTYISWLGYHYFNHTDLPYLVGYSLGGEFQHYTLESVLKEGSLKNKPRPVLDNTIVSGEVRLYLIPFNGSSTAKLRDTFAFIFGLGWGYMDGKITGEFVGFNPKNFETKLNGLYTYRSFQGVYTSGSFGFGYGLIFVRANQVKVEDDLFDQKKDGDDDLILVFDAVLNSFNFHFKF